LPGAWQAAHPGPPAALWSDAAFAMWQPAVTHEELGAVCAPVADGCRGVRSPVWQVEQTRVGVLPGPWQVEHPDPLRARWSTATFAVWHPGWAQVPSGAVCFAFATVWSETRSPV
jgi:hypothetical protein